MTPIANAELFDRASMASQPNRYFVNFTSSAKAAPAPPSAPPQPGSLAWCRQQGFPSSAMTYLFGGYTGWGRYARGIALPIAQALHDAEADLKTSFTRLANAEALYTSLQANIDPKTGDICNFDNVADFDTLRKHYHKLQNLTWACRSARSAVKALTALQRKHPTL